VSSLIFINSASAMFQCVCGGGGRWTTK